MEKARPSHDLADVKRALGKIETLAITTSALRDAITLGFERASICETVSSIDAGMFYKSMTTFADHRIWQDVYHVPVDDLLLYVKVQADVVTGFMLMSFKEK